eukprot:snap_masked-scaffold474_size162001-processed-gene-0.17 protein:Tk10291 transcript:snap_masked-scaffold474_size162001-processed-gene-0.17-mRNA-1 annotation:"neurogenic locus notch-like protein protein 1"
MQVFLSRAPGLFLLWAASIALSSGDKAAWNIQLSDPNREGKFLNVPVFYGDWVPLGNAKSTIEAVAAQVEAGQSPVIGSGLSGELEPSSVDLANERVDVYPVEHVDGPGNNPQSYRRPPRRLFQGPYRRPHRRPEGHRGHRRHRKIQTPGSSFVDQITSFFKPAHQQHAHPQEPLNIKPAHQQHVHPQEPLNRPYPSNIQPADSYPSESFNVGTVYNGVQNVVRPKPGGGPLNAVPSPSFNVPQSQAKETLATLNPVVKLVPAPDLSQDGPPIIELGGTRETVHGAPFVQHQQFSDHLSGFVPVDFEHITSGEKVHRHPHLDQAPKDFSVVVSGFNEQPNSDQLAEYLKQGSQRDIGAYIAPHNQNVPTGFQKIDLPFMEHDQDVGHLPSVFIAPVGFKVPEGYKGHPLPYDPDLAKVNAEGTTLRPSGIHLVSRTTTLPTLVDSPTERTIVTESESAAGSLIKNKIKLAKQRPSLSSLYRGKVQTDTLDNKDENKKKRRILTKIVRRPFKTVRNFFKAPSTKEPATEQEPVTTTITTTTTQEPITTPKAEEISYVNPFLTERTEDFANTAESSTLPTVPVTTYKPSLNLILAATTSKQPELISEEQLFQEEAPANAADQIKYEPEEVVTSGYEPTVVPKVEVFEPTTALPLELEEDAESVFVTTQFVATETSTKQYANYPIVIPTPRSSEAPKDLTQQFFVSPTTEEATTTPEDRSPAYAPTPFSFVRPLRRLDTYNRFKKGTPSTTTTTATTTTTTKTTTSEAAVLAPQRVLIPNQSKYTSKYEGGYGQRIRSRQRLAFWKNDRDQEQSETQLNYQGTTEEPSKAPREYKQKFRPFFDQLYEKLTTDEDKAEEVSQRPLRRRFKGRRRSTTTPNPYTINAQIYEVDPNSGEILSVETATELPVEENGTEVVADYDELYEPTTNYDGTQLNHIAPHSNDYEYLEVAKDSTEAPLHEQFTTPAPLEYQEYPLIPETAIDQEDHETADKHSTPQVPITETAPTSPEPVQDFNSAPTTLLKIPNPYVYPEAPLDYDYVVNDILDRVDVDADNLEYVDTQQVEDAWRNDVDLSPAEGSTVQIYEGERLDTYDKEVAPSLAIAEQHDEQYEHPSNLVNEHSQQHVTALEGQFVPFQDNRQAFKGYSYVEIERDPNGQVLSSETVPVEDIEAVEEALEEIYQDPNVDSLLLPVGVEIEVANTGSSEPLRTIALENIEITEFPSQSKERLIEETAMEIAEEGLVVQEHQPPTVQPVPVSTEEEEEDILAETTVVPPLVSTQTYLEDIESTESNIDSDYVEAIDDLDSPTTFQPEANTDAIPTEATSSGDQGAFNNFSLGGIFDYFLPQSTQRPEHLVINTTEATPEVTEESTLELGTESELEVSTLPNHLLAIDTESVGEEDTLLAYPGSRINHPKAIDTDSFNVPQVDDVNPPKKFLDDKLGYVVKKRERLIQSWVNRQHKDKPRYGTAKTPLATTEYPDSVEASTTSPQHLLAPSTTSLTTLLALDESEEYESLQEEVDKAFFPFAPTIPPKGKYSQEEESDPKESPKKHQLKKQSLLAKYTNARKTHLLKDTILSKAVPATSPELGRIPVGSNPNVYKQWAGNSLSQSEFERQVLGVSTASEVSVKSMICVRGRCYNADDMTDIIS